MAERLTFFLVTCVLFAAPSAAVGQIPAFSGAEGAGANATGGRPVEKLNKYPTPLEPVLEKRGTVYHVTTLEPDPEGVMEGSLMYGLKNENFWYRTHAFQERDIDLPDTFDVTPRIIVFDVGGTIDFSQLPASERDIDITPMNFTIAGQTAPGGITIHGAEFNPGHRESWDTANFYPNKTNNLVLRNLAIRTNDPTEKDALAMPATNSIADHLSLSWHSDEGVSVTDAARDVTIQHTIIGPGTTEPDGQGSQFEGKTSHVDLSVYNNLYIHNAGRIPRVGEKYGDGIELDWRNNVIYNWNANDAGYGGQNSPVHPNNEEYSFTNFVNNYYIGGAGGDSNDDIFNSPGTFHDIYQSGNLLDVNFNSAADGTDLGWSTFTGNETQHTTPFSVPHGVTLTPDEALASVIAHAGANWWDRDFLDQRAIAQLQTYGDSGVPVSEKGQVLNGIAPADVSAVVNAPLQTRAANWDADNDGMPGWWEVRHGLNPNVEDWADDFDGDGYINVEEYVNEIAEWPAPDNIKWSGGNGRYAEILNWGITRSNPDEADTTTNWQPSRFDTAVIDNGTIEVDTVGQHAKFVRLATNASDNATLNVSGGWLKVEDELEVGVDAAATAALNLSGGTLDVGELFLGSGGSFSITGGKLHAEEVAFSLTSNGGTIAPGPGISTFDASGFAESSLGDMHVSGDLTINSGGVEIEIASLLDFDTLSIDGAALLGGELSVALLGAYAPSSLDVFEIITADTVSNTFVNLGDTVDTGFGTFDITYSATSVLLSNFVAAPPALLGDYNDNGVIDAADYAAWRDALTAGATELTNDPTPGVVDESDFTYWRDHFGETLGSGSGQSAVPEPASITLAAMCLLMFFVRAARTSHVGKVESC